MRVMIFFDLPNETAKEKREYRRFRKALLRMGFVMMQESVYSKIALNNTALLSIQEAVRKICTQEGLIQMLVVTERQFERMEMIVGEGHKTVIDSADRFIVL